MVTSAMGGEGKTSLSCHLATSLARSGRKTILVDTDLRRPSLHHLFSQPLGPGISEVLRGEVALEDAIVATEVPELELLAAGECDDVTMRSLAQGGVAPLFERLKATYDCVIIDTAPVLPVTDTLLIAPYTDGVLLSVLNDVSRLPKLSEAHDRLTAIGVKVLGSVFIGERVNGYGKDYRYGDLREPVARSRRNPTASSPRPRSPKPQRHDRRRPSSAEVLCPWRVVGSDRKTSGKGPAGTMTEVPPRS